MMQSSGTVRKVIDEEAQFMVSFFEHDGYFKIDKNDGFETLVEKVNASLAAKQEISFSFEPDLTIVSIA